MQQSSSQQLKCYGRRNRSKPEPPSTLECGPPLGKKEDVGRAAAADSEETTPSAERKTEVLTHLKSSPQSGSRGRPRKVIGSLKQGERGPSHVAGKNMPTTRAKSAGKPLASEAREASRDVTPPLEDSSSPSEASTLKTPGGSPDRQEETVISLKSEGPLRNGGSEYGRRKSLASISAAGSQRTRSQIAKEEAQQASGGGQSDRVSRAIKEKKSGGQVNHGRKDGGQVIAEKKSSGVGSSHLERKDGGHLSVRDRENANATKQSSLAASRRYLALQKRQREDMVLLQADEIFRKQEFVEANKDKKGQPKSKEPARLKTHWDFVIEEMTWLAKDFERERKWKLNQAKKVAIRVSRSKLDVEARENRRLKEEELRVRRVASGIAKDVKKFWLKVDKLVSYKQQLLIEERKKKALDKHLDFLLGQTERYSTMLAENLADTTIGLESQNTLLLPPIPLNDSADIGQELVPFEAVSNIEGNQISEVNGVMEFGGGDEDFMLEDEEEQEDDEATLEADEALITEEERKEELSALQRESELPIEELLRAYSSLRSSTDSEVEEAEDEEDEEADEEDVVDEEEMFASDALDVDAWKDKPQIRPRRDEGPSTSKEIEDVAVLKGRRIGAPGSEKENGDIATVVPESLGALGGLELDVTGKVCINLQDEANLDIDKFLGPGKTKSSDVVGETASSSMSTAYEGSKDESAFEAGNATALVVELADGNPQSSGLPSFSVTSSERILQRQSRLRTGLLDLGMARELQDDSDYIPAALADGNDEDDERTLEEEERMASDEGAGTIDEIDQLKLESEMSIEELMAKYRSAASEVGEDFEEFSPDRRDRTSEAGTSGSSDEEDDDVEDEVARDVAEAKERMGEPSTSGRFHPSMALTENGKRKEKSQLIDSLEVKQEVVDAKVFGGGHENLQEMGRRLQEPKDPELVMKNHFLSGGSSRHALSATSLLLEVDGEDDAETAAAVAKVTAAAKQRRERVVIRSVKMRDILGNEAEDPARDNLDNDVKISLPTAALEVVESGDDKLTNPSPDMVVYDTKPSNTDTPNLDLVDMDPLGITTSSVEDETMLTTPGDISNLMDKKQTASPVKDDNTELVDDGSVELKHQEAGAGKSNEDKLADFAAAAQSAQPTGYTFSTTKVKTKLPFLLKHSLREYQHIGLDWLVTMYEKRLNGILADEMGLGKTIMTIALLAHLACEKGIWGPHLIVVPTSVMLNWETEFMKWCPAFKILTYFGNAKERKVKRQGWSRPNSFHVCITTYRLVIQDAKAFKRKKWKYLILDEAHLIKNWKSQRWQTLLNFNSKRRILLTGTPLQNDLMELWSLMHFLMPHVFQSHQEFRDWFSNPITGMVEGENQVNKELVDRLHNVLRPFLLRRLKKDVEKQLPGKFEHVIRCRLSKRQRNLYEDFMASSDTQATLSSGNFLGLINVLMQLRKVCNHPDLFEGRPIISSFDMPGIEVHFSTAACSAMSMGPFDGVNMEALNLLYMQQDESMTKWEGEEVAALKTPGPLIVELASTGEDTWKQTQSKHKPSKEVRSVIEEIQSVLQKKREKERKERVLAISSINELRCSQYPLYGADFVKCVEVTHPVYDVHKVKANPSNYLEFSSVIANIVQLPLTRVDNLMDLIAAFVFAIPAARAPLPVAWCSHLPHTSEVLKPSFTEEVLQEATAMLVPLRPVVVRRQLFFPDRRLLQFDCGKLQELAVLLRRLKSEGHRALIFTQMTKMLDVLESFINLYGYTYMRLDGSTKPEQRQILMQRFNTNPKIFLFILSTRSGGVGINLVGADTVIFYDSDWNPAMDQQAQDRCHRIGQTREVHIYRLISESTIEENILKKANQKRILDDLVIQSGSYNTEFFKKLDPMELFSGLKGVKVVGSSSKGSGITPVVSPADISGVSSVRIAEQKELSNAEVEAALKNAEDEADYMAMKRVEQEEAAENQEFTEEVFAGNLDDEDLADDVDDVGRSGKSQTEGMGVTGLPKGDRVQEDSGIGVTPEDIPFGESSIIPADADEDMDMLADVRQMAAAAAASGRGSVSFEDQLRPIERYAMRFLELWDPRVDNLAVEAQVAFEEKEWELDQLEKLKEEQEAEIDEDNEPLYYETWDTALADEAYRQQVDILVQQQEQKQLEWEAMEEELRDADRAVAEAAAAVVGAENFTMKSKGKKKLKKAKFKSLAEGSLMSDTDDASLGEDYTLEGSNDPTYRDLHSDMLPLPHRSPSQRKRKAPKLLDEEMLVEMHTKKFKKDVSNKIKGFSAEKDKGKKKYLDGNSTRTISGDASEDRWPGAVNEEGMVLPRSSGGPGGALSGGKNKAGGKITLLGMHPKKGPLVMLEKERKKDFSRSQDHVPPASPWKHAEDAVLCAVVHEYGGNWQLASDALAGGPDGGVYRGRHRHPIHCRERFRQLLAQNAAAASGDPTSEKSALSAATNAQLKVTEEHTKRLLDAVLQHSDDELLLQRHFMAVLTASQNWKKQSSEKLPTTSEMQSLRIRSFVPLQNLVQPHPLLPSLGKRKVSPQEVIAALTQVDKEPKSASTQGLQRASSKEQASKDQSSKVDDEAFSVAQFLVGFSEVEGEGASQDDGGVALQSHSLPSPMSLEAFLGISTTVPSPPPPHFAKAVRQSAEILMENRFRFATRIGWDGSAREWAAAGGSGTGVWGVHLPTKGKGVAKKRPAPDPSKPPKPKQPKTPKTSLKKDRSGEPSPTTMVSGEHTKGHVAQNGESCGTGTPSSELPGPSGSPGVGDPVMKISTSRPKKNPKHTAVPSPQSGTGQLDLNVQQPDVFLLEAGSKVINSKKVKKKAGGSSALGGSEISQRTEKKNSKATPTSVNHLAVDSVAGAKMGVEYTGSHISAAQALSSASKWKGSPGRGFDLNGSSDEDLAVLGVSPASPGRRLHGSNPPMAVPIGRSELSRFISGADTLGSSKRSDEDRDGFNNLNYSGLGQRATANTQQAKSAQSPARLGPYSSPGSLASLRGDPKGSTHATPGNPGPVTSSHIMRRPDWQSLSASPAQEHLLASSFSKGLSQFHWPPAPGSWPLPLPNDLDSPADIMRFADSVDISPSELRAFPSLKGKHNAEGLPQFKSPVEQETGQSPGTLPSSLVSCLQTPEGRSWMANVRGDHILQHEILERQRHGGSNLHPQPQGLARAAGQSPPGGVDPLRQSLGYAPPGSLRSPFGSSSLPLQHSHSRPHVSPSRSMKAPPNLQPPSSPNPPMYNHPSFPGFTLQPFRSSESPAAVDTDLGLSLGSGVPKKQLGVNNSQDHQPHTSSS